MLVFVGWRGCDALTYGAGWRFANKAELELLDRMGKIVAFTVLAPVAVVAMEGATEAVAEVEKSEYE